MYASVISTLFFKKSCLIDKFTVNYTTHNPEERSTNPPCEKMDLKIIQSLLERVEDFSEEQQAHRKNTQLWSLVEYI